MLEVARTVEDVEEEEKVDVCAAKYVVEVETGKDDEDT